MSRALKREAERRAYSRRTSSAPGQVYLHNDQPIYYSKHVISIVRQSIVNTTSVD